MHAPSRCRAAFAALVLVAACAESPLAPAANAAPVDNGVSAVSYDAARARTISVAGCAGSAIFLTADEKATLDLHNTQRKANGLPAFCVDAKLTAAARAHSDDMLSRSYFSHTSVDGTTFGTRLSTFGYAPFSAVAENIAMGTGPVGGPEQTFSNWMNSAGHRANIQNGKLREIGVGVSAGTFQGYANSRMYTVDFATH